MTRYNALASVIVCIGALCVVTALSTAAPVGKEGPAPVGEASGKLLFADDFSQGMDNWWVEGGIKTWVQDGRLHMDAEPGGARTEQRTGYVCTAWCKQAFTGDVKIALDAHVLRSDTIVNNINMFLHYTDPSGKPLYETRASRADAAYNKYHELNGYIFTFLHEPEAAAAAKDPDQARVRIRRCPGFKLLKETYTYHCRQKQTYHIELVKRGGTLTISVDGNELLSAEDPEPLAGGQFGLRTFRTYLWWDNVKVFSH